MVYFAGIDAGSVFTKAVVLEDKSLLSSYIIPSMGNYAKAAGKALEEALAKIQLSKSDILRLVATGIAASRIPFSTKTATEMTCISTGLYHLFSSARTIIDIGGQASRVIKIDGQGRVSNFLISEKCAAGSGRFLQMIARVLQVNLEDIGELSLKSKSRVSFSTSCAVFAESEAITRIAEGATKEDILAGVHYALAKKIASMVEAIGLTMDCAIVGGGAKDIGLIKSVGEGLRIKLLVPDDPQIIAAFGAALIAQEKILDKNS